ncbi:hypothetical protein HYV73_02900 [Candidatus Uhrbacteria bacterium]|nr:hypothetical protein [Candidatus Uhrbacteria bacterium]
MTLLTRKFLFFFSVILFLVLAPLLVLRSAGYRIHFQTLRLLKTGALSVSSTPDRADVELAGEGTFSSTPTLIPQLFPGIYTATVTKDHFIPWTQTIRVESGLTTFLHDIPLYRAEKAAPVRETKDFIFADPIRRRLFRFVRSAGWTECWSEKADGSEAKLFARIPLTVNESTSIRLSSGGGWVLLSSRPAPLLSQDGFIIRVDTGESIRPRDIEPLAQNVPPAAAWDPSQEGMLFLRPPDAGFEGGRRSWKRLDLSAQELVPPEPISEGPNDFTPGWSRGSAVYGTVSAPENRTALVRIEHQTQTFLSYLPQGFEPVSSLVKTDGSHLLLQSASGRSALLFDENQPDEPPTRINGTLSTIHPTNPNVYAVTDGLEIGTFDFSTGSTGTWLRLGTPIKDIVWDAGGAAIIYAQNDKISAVDTAAGTPVITPLADGNVQAIWVEKNILWAVLKNGDKTTVVKRRLR